jgi:hypothetical protein
MIVVKPSKGISPKFRYRGVSAKRPLAKTCCAHPRLLHLSHPDHIGLVGLNTTIEVLHLRNLGLRTILIITVPGRLHLHAY